MLDTHARWQDSADIVVAGYGGAGAVAAIAAHDLGADVLVLEKQPRDGHCTNTSMSAGAFLCPTDVEAVSRHLEDLYRVDERLTWTDRDTLRAWAEYSHRNKAWVEAMGAKLKLRAVGGEHREVPGGEGIERWHFAGAGVGMHRFLTSQVAQRGVRVLFDTPAERLITDLDGEVVGVRATSSSDGRTMDIKARRAVIMTTGGFEYNEEMKLNYLKVYPTYFFGAPANTGDGHRMVMELGADLWHMNCCSARLVAKFPDFPISFTMDLGGGDWIQSKQPGDGRKPAGYVVVDRDGRRFTSENFKSHSLYYELTVYDSQGLRYPRVPCTWVFGQDRMEAGPLAMRTAGPAGPVQLYHWAADNSAELEKGWVVRADSLHELAVKMGLPPENLTETVERYHTYCRDGHDPEFGRRPADLSPICGPPFYAVHLYPGGPNTQGGPRRNCRAQVLRVDGDPIPRLYAAGELGSIFGMLYPAGGANLAECIAFGRIAAENAVKEELRT
ncbi:MAG: FAD-dependent oxidoreductase [Dehalococcoidia bacterium]|nr:FAD-dependent oxidoreductase [Dehalococcoidia bacterium]